MSRCVVVCCSSRAGSHVITALWNIGNNSPIYFNTLARASARIARNFGKKATDATNVNAGAANIVGLVIVCGSMLVFIEGNQLAYAEKVYQKLFKGARARYDTHECGNVFVELISNLTKSAANTISMANFVSSFFKHPTLGNYLTTIPLSLVALFTNVFANGAFYADRRRVKFIYADNLSPATKKGWRHFCSLFFALTSGIFYAMSLVNFRKHIELVEEPDLGFSSTAQGAITLCSVAAGTLVFLATHGKYNEYIARFLGQDKRNSQLPGWYKKLVESLVVVVGAAVAKALISATSCYALVWQLANGLLWPAFLTAGVPIIFTAAVQYALLGKESNSREEELPLNANMDPKYDQVHEQAMSNPGLCWWLISCCRKTQSAGTEGQTGGLNAWFWRKLDYTGDDAGDAQARNTSWCRLFTNCCSRKRSLAPHGARVMHL